MYLLTDDENIFISKIRMIVKMAGIVEPLEAFNKSEETIELFKSGENKPKIMLCDLNIKGAKYDGIQMIDVINNELGNGVVIGIISTSDGTGEYKGDPRFSGMTEMEAAKKVGANFWIQKGGMELKDRFIEFSNDYKSGQLQKEFKSYL